LGISPKRLDGWEPTETHTYTYDDAGRVASVTVTRESEWDDGERALVLALELYQRQCCPNGHWLPESADPDSEGQYSAAARRCHACLAVSYETKRVDDDPHPSAFVYRVTRR
jgi:hypothetical protein